MRTSVTSLSKKFISTFFAATLTLGLVPAAAFATEDDGASAPNNAESAEADSLGPEDFDQDVISSEVEKSAPIEQYGDEVASNSFGEDETVGKTAGGDDSITIPAATQRVNEDVALTSRTVAQAESTRSYFLAQTLESTRTVPIVSANLPLDTSSTDVVGPDAEGEGPSSEEEGDAEGDDSDGEGDPAPVDTSLSLHPENTDSAISAESTVVGSFTYRGITYAVEPGGESVAIVAADYSKLPEEFIEAQVIVLPSMVTADGLDYYSVTRIADYAFSAVKPSEDEESITAITVPASITSIGEDALTGFDTLQYVIVSEDNPNYSMYDGALYDADQTSLLLIPEGRLGAVRIAPSVTEIDPEVFSHCPSVDTLVADTDSAAYQLLIENDTYKDDVADAVDVMAGRELLELPNNELEFSYSGFFEVSPEEQFDSFKDQLIRENDDSMLVMSSEWSLMTAVGGMSEFLVLSSGEEYKTYQAGSLELNASDSLSLSSRLSYDALAVSFYCSPDIAYRATAKAGYGASSLTDNSAPHWNSSPFKVSGIYRWQWYRSTYNYATIRYHTNWSSGEYPYHDITIHSCSGGYSITSPFTNSAATTRPSVGTEYSSSAVYSRATANSYTVTFDNQSADAETPGTESLRVTYNADVPGIIPPQRAGYVFEGYFESVDEDGHGIGDPWFDWSGEYVKLKTYVDLYEEEPSYRWGTAKNMTLKAGWTIAEHDIVFDPNDGTTTDEEALPCIWVYEGKQLPSRLKTPGFAFGEQPYDPETGDYVEDANNGELLTSPDSGILRHRDGYEFLGYWTAPFDEGDSSRQIYDADLKPVGDGLWRESGPITARLYAHWKYKIELFDNAYDSEGKKMQASIDWDSIPSSGEGFSVVREGEGAPYIDARYGAPIPLPKASREGYGDTRAWGLASGTNGKAGWVVRETDDFYTANADGAKASPSDASYTRNGAAAETYSVAPGLEDHTLILYASWLWDAATPDADKVAPGGGKNKYKVRLKATYAIDGVVSYVSDWSTDAVLEDVEYDSIISSNELSMKAPSFVSVTGADHDVLVFKGFYTAPNVPVPAEGEDFQGVRLIASSDDDPASLAGIAPMRVLPEEGSDERVLYALWTLPVTHVVFHLNEAGLEAPVGFAAAKADPDALAKKNGVPYVVEIETNDAIPAIAGDIAVPTNTASGKYSFNGWWTHPWKEGTDSTQYYDAANRPVEKDGKRLTWKPYIDTVLYAHWTYEIVFDKNTVEDVTVVHKGSLPLVSEGAGEDAYGNVYHHADGGTQVVSVTAILGAPVKLPYTTERAGYVDACAWSAIEDALRGVLSADADGFTLKPAGAGQGKPAISPDASGKVTLYADWSDRAKTYTVKLAAAYPIVEGEDAFTVSDPGTSKIENVKYDHAFNSVVSTIDAPWRDGYTFMGYYPQRFPALTDPGLLASATCYIAGVQGEDDVDTASVTDALWKEAPATGDEVTLYAAWKKDSYNVAFAPTALKDNGAAEALTPGTEPVTASAIAGRTWSFGERMDASEFPVASKLQESPAPFFRNGYDFAGWYYVSEDGKTPIKVSEGTGTPGETECGRDVTWTPSKAWQVEHRGDTGASVILYAAWSPKVYELRFDLARPGETDAMIPSATYPAAANRTNVKQATDGTYYYEVRYGERFSPWFGEDGTSASVPSFEPYTFMGWTYDGEHLFSDDATEASGVFAPSYDIARWSEGVNVIVYAGDWKAPGAKTVTFHAAAHGTYEEGTPCRVDAHTLRVDGVEYSPNAVEIGSDMSPHANGGYVFEGYVQGPLNGSEPADLYIDGKRNEAYALVHSLVRVKDDMHLWAVYSKDPMSVTLKVPQGATVYESEDTDAKRAALVYPFDVEDDPFTLPADVRQPGKRFVGWKLEGSTDEPSKTVTIVPSVIAGSTSASLSYVPVMEDRVYRVTFDLDYRAAADESAGDARYVYLTYDGIVVDRGTLEGAVKDAPLAGMPLAPEPKAQKDETSGTWRSYPFTSWWVGTNVSMLSPVKKGAGEAVTVDEWHSFFDRASFTKAIAEADMTEADKKAKATDSLTVYAEWNSSLSAICPLYVTLALDTQTGDVAIPERDYSIESSNGTSLKVAALRYDRIDAVDASGGKTSPFARASEDEVPVHLNVFAGDAAENLDMGRATIMDGIVSGHYGTGGDRENLVRIDLSAPSTIYTPYEHALFAAFDTDDENKKVQGALKIRYGLDLNGVSTTTLSRIRTLMPSQNGTLASNGWTAEQVPVARLLYTVALA